MAINPSPRHRWRYRTMDLATKQGQQWHGTARAPNPSPTRHQPVTQGWRRGPLKEKQGSSSRNRSPVPVKQTIGRAIIKWLGTLTLSGGDLDGQPFTVWPWEKRFIIGTFGQPGNAALSIARGNGKSGFCAALAAAVVCPGAPLHGVKREVVCVASLRPARKNIRGRAGYAREAWAMTWPTGACGGLQDSANMATLEYRPTGARVKCIGSDPKRAHGLRPFLVLFDEPAQTEAGSSEAMISALRTGLGKTPGSRA